jgi:nicotinamide-nucleotide amidase
MVIVEILAIGNELLIGQTLDTNTNWIIKKITGMGGKVNRSVILRDDRDAIATEIQSALQRKAEIIFTIGGMGPTADDMTLEAIAQAIKQPLEPNQTAIAFVSQKYQEFAQEGYVEDATITPEREKMGILPLESIPVNNPLGVAPGVISQVKDSIIISLPGVPKELQGIFNQSLPPIFQEKFSENIFLEKIAIVDSKDESVIAPLLAAVARKNPEVYIKSRPKEFGINLKFKVTLYHSSKLIQGVETINQAVEDLQQEFGNAGISVDLIK